MQHANHQKSTPDRQPSAKAVCLAELGPNGSALVLAYGRSRYGMYSTYNEQ